MRARFTTHVCGPRLRSGDAITALRDAGVSVTLHPLPVVQAGPDDESFEISVPVDTNLSQRDFEASVRIALAGTGFRRVGAILAGS